MAEGLKTFTVKPDCEHHVIVEGTPQVLRVGDTTEMSDEQYAAFKDKFYTEEEAAAYAVAISAAVAKLRVQEEATTQNPDSGATSATGDPVKVEEASEKKGKNK